MKVKNHIPQIVIFVFAFTLYANTLGHQYALDDKMTFWKNEFVQNGANGIKDILSYDSMAGMFGKETEIYYDLLNDFHYLYTLLILIYQEMQDHTYHNESHF